MLTLTFTSRPLRGTHTDDRNVVLKFVYDDSDCDSYQGEPKKNDTCLKMYFHSFFNNELWRQAPVCHLGLSNMAQRHVAFCERHVALHGRHVALHECHVALHVRHAALLIFRH